MSRLPSPSSPVSVSGRETSSVIVVVEGQWNKQRKRTIKDKRRTKRQVNKSSHVRPVPSRLIATSLQRSFLHARFLHIATSPLYLITYVAPHQWCLQHFPSRIQVVLCYKTHHAYIWSTGSSDESALTIDHILLNASSVPVSDSLHRIWCGSVATLASSCSPARPPYRVSCACLVSPFLLLPQTHRLC